MKLVSKKAFINGKIFTCDDNNPRAEAVVTGDDKILFAGDYKGAKRFIDSETQIIDLDGKLVLPGFIDSHLHFMTGGFALTEIDLSDVKSKDEFCNALRNYMCDEHAGWITGGNWDNNKFTDGSVPSKEWVDEIVPDVPLFLTRSDLHMGLANSKALQLAGINKNTPDQNGGIIKRDSKTGEPTGLLIDSAMNNIFNIMPEPTVEKSLHALECAVNAANKYGITSVHDVVYPKDYTVYQEYMKSRNLTCRINLIRPVQQLDDYVDLKIQMPFGNKFLQLGCLKSFADGSLGSSTAWFYEPYEDDKSTSGLPTEVLTDGRLKEWALEADRNKLQLAIHAIGDQAVSAVLDIYEEIVNTNPKWDRRLRLEHAQHIRLSDIARINKLGVIVSMQPLHLYYDSAWCSSKIGDYRLKGTYAIKSIMESGACTIFGSDWTVTDMNPIMGIYSAVTRRVVNDKYPEGWNPEERISVEQAVKAYTINAAYASYNENEKGSIEPGKLADMVVLSENIFEIDCDKICDVSVLKTIFGGELVYDAEKE